MRRLRLLLLPIAIAASLPAWSQPAPAASAPLAGDTVVLRAGNFTLSRDDYEKLSLGFDRAVGAVTTGASPQSVQSGTEVARLLTLVSEAQRRKIDQTPKMQELMRVRGYVLLANGLLAALSDDVKRDEAGTRALYNSEKNTYVDVHARQILLRFQGSRSDTPNAKGSTRTEAQAKALALAAYQKLKAGADFATLAQSVSDDESTRAKGGELPAFTRGAMQAEFEKVAYELPVGSVSEPFKTVYGYHVVRVDERRPFAFERVRASLEFIRAKQMLEDIATKGNQLNEAYFKP